MENEKQWEIVSRDNLTNMVTTRLRAEGGWLYRVRERDNFASMCFVPEAPAPAPAPAPTAKK